MTDRKVKAMIQHAARNAFDLRAVLALHAKGGRIGDDSRLRTLVPPDIICCFSFQQAMQCGNEWFWVRHLSCSRFARQSVERSAIDRLMPLFEFTAPSVDALIASNLGAFYPDTASDGRTIWNIIERVGDGRTPPEVSA